MTIVQSVKGVADRRDKFDPREKRQDQENFFDTKPKPLPRNNYVTNGDESQLVAVRITQRIRNAIDDTFRTIPGGLFAQELVPKGTTFGGVVTFAGNEDPFISRAVLIMKNLRPVINGALLEPELMPTTEDSGSASRPSINKSAPCIVIKPLPYNEARFDLAPEKYESVKIGDNDEVRAQGANHILLTTARRYNTTLRRPRQNRIVIGVGSILHGEENEHLLAWKGFGKAVLQNGVLQDLSGGQHNDEGEAAFEISQDEIDTWADMSRSQKGQLRELLHPGLTPDMLQEMIEKRLEKYGQWKIETIDKKLVPGKLLRRLLSLLQQNNVKSEKRLESMRAFIREVLDRIAIRQWDQTGKERAEKKYTRNGTNGLKGGNDE